MGLFSSVSPSSVGVIFDIGSASVLVAIVVSDPKVAYPTIVWSHREQAGGRESSSPDQMSKNVLAALFNASLELDTVGRKVLKQAYPKAGSPGVVQISVAAPWAHTATKTVIYTQDDPFKITLEVLSDLESAAQKMILNELRENELLAPLNLRVFTQATTEVLANGYAIKSAAGQSATTITLSRTNALVPVHFIEAVKEIEEKMFQVAETKGYSFMLAYYYVARALYPDLLEYCLVDITFEAIEIGIVREGMLRFCSHVSYGAYTLARDAAQIRQISIEEAYGSMVNGLIFDSKENSKQTAAIEELIIAFENRIAALFLETGDSLSIPKTIIVHSALTSEPFFKERITKAANKATHGTSTVIGISDELVTRYYPAEMRPQLLARHDTGVLVSAQFFHSERQRGELEI